MRNTALKEYCKRKILVVCMKYFCLSCAPKIEPLLYEDTSLIAHPNIFFFVWQKSHLLGR